MFSADPCSARFVAFREQNDAFPEYPEEDAGGSVFIFDPPPAAEPAEGEEAGGDADPKGKTGGGDKKKGGDDKKKGGDKKKGKKGEGEEEEEAPAELPTSGFVLRMQASI